MATVLVLAYSAWAIYSGYQVISGRFEWLDRRAPLSIFVKFILSCCIGYLIAGFYLIYLIFKWILFTARM